MLRLLFLFLHVTGATGMFATLGVEGAALLQLRGAGRVSDVAAALRVQRVVPMVGASSALLTLLTGIYLATVYWRWRGPWIGIGLAALVLAASIGATVNRTRVARLQAELAAADPTGGSPPRPDPVLYVSYMTRACSLVGVVFLMTVKPPLVTSLVAMAVAIGAGLLAGTAARRRATA